MTVLAMASLSMVSAYYCIEIKVFNNLILYRYLIFARFSIDHVTHLNSGCSKFDLINPVLLEHLPISSNVTPGRNFFKF